MGGGLGRICIFAVFACSGGTGRNPFHAQEVFKRGDERGYVLCEKKKDLCTAGCKYGTNCSKEIYVFEQKEGHCNSAVIISRRMHFFMHDLHDRKPEGAC